MSRYYEIKRIVGYTYLDGSPVDNTKGWISPRCGPEQKDIQWLPGPNGEPYGQALELVPIIQRERRKWQAYIPGSGNPGGH